jgi:hypothetical protein
MTVIAGTLLVTHGTDLRALPSQGPMVIGKINRVIESVKDDAISRLLMTFRTERPLVAEVDLSRMNRRAAITYSGKQQDDQNGSRRLNDCFMVDFQHRYSSSELNL